MGRIVAVKDSLPFESRGHSRPRASSPRSDRSPRKRARAYSAVYSKPGTMSGCQIRSVTASFSARIQSSAHRGYGPSHWCESL